MERLKTEDALTNVLRKTDANATFIPPDTDDVCWKNGADTFTRTEVAHLLWIQIAMIGNDLKTHCGSDLTADMFDVLEYPRIPKF